VRAFTRIVRVAGRAVRTGGDAPEGSRVRRFARRADALAVPALALALAFGLKLFHSRAGFDELRWVLDPTVRLVEWFGAGPFELEAHRAWLSRAHAFEVVAACAGVNFLIAAFLSLALGLAPSRRAWRGRLAFLAACAVSAYATTLLANATRIAFAMRLHEAGAPAGPVMPDRLHTVAGIVVYFVFLGVLFAAAARLTDLRGASRTGPGLPG
jgi:exosortase K